MSLARNVFTNLPVEFEVTPRTKVVFVSDFYATDLQGGAELTTEALLEKAPCKVTRLHSTSLSHKLLTENQDKIWVFGNFSNINHLVLAEIVNGQKYNYSIIEFDFKYCRYRSELLHSKNNNGTPCDCPSTIHGHNIAKTFEAAKNIYWMSELQKELWLSKNHQFDSNKQKHYFLGSLFTDKEFDSIRIVKKIKTPERRKEETGIISAPLKSQEEVQYLQERISKLGLSGQLELIPQEQLQGNQLFHTIGSRKNIAIVPEDLESTNRFFVASKLLECNVFTGDNILIRNEQLFKKPSLEIEQELKSRVQLFWDSLLA